MDCGSLSVKRTFLELKRAKADDLPRRLRSTSDFDVCYGELSQGPVGSDVSTCEDSCSSAGESCDGSECQASFAPPGTFHERPAKASQAPASTHVPTAQVYLVPVLMDGVQMLMPMAAQSRPQPAQRRESVDERTTLMLRNLPKTYTRSAVLRMLDAAGFVQSYCFVYVPTDFKHLKSFGYAFVAFHTHTEAARAKNHFQGFQDWEVYSEQSCDVAWSGAVQGTEQHVERYRNSPVMHSSVPDEYKPAVFLRGVRVAFPRPTRTIQPPRQRQNFAGEVIGGGVAEDGFVKHF